MHSISHNPTTAVYDKTIHLKKGEMFYSLYICHY